MQMDAKLAGVIMGHIGIEIGNSIAYLNAFSWASANGWEGFAERWRKAAADEQRHAADWTEYLARRGEVVSVHPSVGEIKADSVKALCESEALLESDTEKSMHAIAAVADEVQDADALEFISGKLLEQTKDSKKSADFAARIKGTDDGVLALIDRQIESQV